MAAMAKRKGFGPGIALFLLVNASFIFMLISPLVENPVGRYLDDRLLDDIDARIEEVRTGEFTVRLVDSQGKPLSGREVSYRLVRHDFIFGCNLFALGRLPGESRNRLYEEYFGNLFNTAVLPFYWRQNEPERGRLVRTEELKRMLDWCDKNRITPKGHPLAWRNPAGHPGWLPDDRDRKARLLEGRIRYCVRTYRDRIRLWDVVNEPTHLPPFTHDTAIDYVEDALRWARDEDPDALLTVNDYGILGHDFGCGPFHRLIRGLLDRSAPIGCIGFQGHEPRTDWIPAYELRATFDGYAGLGLPIHITEITVPSAGLPVTNSWKKGVWTEEGQAEYLERFYKVCMSHPSVGGVIYWDLWDGQSWIKSGGLISEDMEPKPAYQRLDRLINRDWRTRGKGVTDGDGVIGFKGFFGEYELIVSGIEGAFEVSLRKEGSRGFKIKVDDARLSEGVDGGSGPGD